MVLYINFDIASRLTGNFRIINKKNPEIYLQLKRNADKSKKDKDVLRRLLTKYTKYPINIKLINYNEFKYFLKTDYIRKNKYLVNE